MAIDLETQLRSLGRALDSHTSPVRATEVADRSRDREAAGVMKVGPPVAVTAVQRHKRRWVLLAATAAVLVIGIIGSIAVLGRSPDLSSPAVSDNDQPSALPPVGSTSGSEQSASTTVAVREPELLEVTIIPAGIGRPRPDLFPIVRDPDVAEAFGQYSAEVGMPLVTGLVGRIEGERLSDGIRLELRTEPLDAALVGDPQIVEIDGTDLDVYANGDSSTVVLPGEPAITVSGQDPVSFLRETGLDVVSFDPANPSASVTINEAALPPGYQIILGPQPESVDALSAYTATSLANSDGPSVSVSLTSPLASLAIHDVVELTEVNGTPAWAATTPGGYTIIWQVSESTWAQARVRGGPDESLSLAESVEFAGDVDFVGETEWRAHYRVAEPWFDDGDAFIGIDRGSADGIEVGMLVESNGIPIGKVAQVTDSTSDVLHVSNTAFSIDAKVSGTSPSATTSDCRVRGGNDHVGYVCDRPFNEQERAGAEVVATGNSTAITEGTSFGTITSIIDINGEPVGLLELLEEFPIAGGAATVAIPA